MTKRSRTSPNTLLGEVHWYADMHFGTMQWVCQEMLGLRDPKDTKIDFLNTQKHSVSDLREMFGEIELSNGKLGLEVFLDTYQMNALCVIDTTASYSKPLSDQDFLNLIEDFKEHVRGLPLANPGDGKLITDPNEPGYETEDNQCWLKRVSEMSQMLGAVHEAAKDQLKSEGIIVRSSSDEPEDDIPF